MKLKEIGTMGKWSFLDNHAIVLIQIAKQPGGTSNQIASAANISYRALRTAINDLYKDRYIIKEREGRGFRYQINPEIQLHQIFEGDDLFKYFCLLWDGIWPVLDN